MALLRNALPKSGRVDMGFRSGDKSTGPGAIFAQGYDSMAWQKGTLGQQ